MEFRRVLFRSSSAFDPSVLRAWPIRRRDRAFGAAPIEDCLAVSGRNQLHTVIGGVHHGVRIDVAGSRAALPVERLIFYRKSFVLGKSVSVRFHLGGGRTFNKTNIKAYYK